MSRDPRPTLPGDPRPGERRGPVFHRRRLVVRSVERSPEERRFSGPAELARPIALDRAAARRVLGAEPIPFSSQTCLVKSPIR